MSAVPLRNSKLSFQEITEQQHRSIDALFEGNRLLIAKPGFGKTVVGATAIQELIAAEVVERVLIVAPLRVCREAWRPVWSAWGHLVTTHRLATGDVRARRAAIESPAQVVVINIENLPWLLKEYGHDHGFDGLLIDEISKFKSAGSKGVKKLRHHLVDFEWRCGMSATPVAEAPEDIFSQALIIDGGAALGRRKDRFLANYFYQTDWQGYTWELRENALERLVGDLAPVLYVADDLAYQESLPPLNMHRYLITLPPFARDAYDALCSDGLHETEQGMVEVPNAAVLQGKLQQVCCGAVYTVDGTSWLHRAKYDALAEMLQEDNQHTIVVYQFDYEKDELRQRFPGIRFLTDGAVDVNVADWNAGRLPVLALHPKSGGHGLNLQDGGHRMVWLSPVWSADLWTQTIARLWRQGQNHPVNIWVLTVMGTVEELILDRLEQKSTGEQEFADAFREHLRAQSDQGTD